MERSILACRIVLAACAAIALYAGSAAAGSLEVGATAPAFSLRGSDGESYELAQFVGKRGVVLAWFPKAFTPG